MGDGFKYAPFKGSCQGCADRQVGCHARCERYQRARTEGRRVSRWLGIENSHMLTRPDAKAPKSKAPKEAKA